jgi:hypothetical protein
MKNIQRILPFVAVVGVLAAAITYVLSSQPARPTDPVPVAKASAQNLLPPSDRYAAKTSAGS